MNGGQAGAHCKVHPLPFIRNRPIAAYLAVYWRLLLVKPVQTQRT